MIKFNIGDKVRIARKVEREEGWRNMWVAHMTKEIGKVSTITEIGADGYRLADSVFGYPASALEPGELVEDKSLIEIGKQYQTRDGKQVRILCVDIKTEEYPVAALVLDEGQESLQRFTADGRYYENRANHESDLVEVSPYAEFKIDEPVLVRNAAAQPWYRRHFAGIAENGKPTAFDMGGTSWGEVAKVEWNECLRPCIGYPVSANS